MCVIITKRIDTDALLLTTELLCVWQTNIEYLIKLYACSQTLKKIRLM